MAPLSAGVFEYPEEKGRRILRGLAFVQDFPEDSAWAHPVDGLVAYVDVVSKAVTRCWTSASCPSRPSTATTPIRNSPARCAPRRSPSRSPSPRGPASRSPAATTSSGRSGRLDVGFDVREGVVLHNIGFQDGDRAAHHQPGIHRRDGGPVRRSVAGPLLAELLRHRRIPGGPVRQLAGTGLRLPGRDHLPHAGRSPTASATRARSATAICMHEEDYGILCQALRPVDGHQLHPPQPAPGGLLLHHHRQLRLRLLLVPLPRRHHRIRGQGHRRRLHLAPTRARATPTPPRWPRAWARRSTSTCSAPGWTWRWTASPTGSRKRTRCGCRSARATSAATPSPARARCCAPSPKAVREADAPAGRTWHISNPESRNRLGEPVGYKLHAAGPAHAAGGPGVVGRPARAASPPRTCGSPGTPRRSATRPATSSTSTPAAPGCPPTWPQDRDIDGEDIVVWHTFGLTHFPRVEDWPIMPVDTADSGSARMASSTAAPCWTCRQASLPPAGTATANRGVWR